MRSELSRTQIARRQDIILAAIKIINSRGYADATIMAIAKEAHTSKSTVLYHFTSKDRLVQAVIGSVYSDGAAYMKPRIDAVTTMKDKLHAYIVSNIEYLAQHVEQIASVHQIMLNASSKISQDYGSEAVRLLEQLFKIGQVNGEFGDFDANVMALSLRSVIDGSSFYILRNPDIDVAAYALSISTMFERATKK